MIIIEQDMDLLDDSVFDPEEVFCLTDGASSLQAAPVASQVYNGSSLDQLPPEHFRYEEDRSDQPPSPGEESVDAFEDLDDAAFIEALQHNPGGFGPQNPCHGQHANTIEYADDSILNEDVQTLEGLNDQVAFHAECRPLQTHKTSNGKQFQHVEGDTNGRTSYEEQEMIMLDNLAFEEPDCIGHESRSAQMSKQPSASSQAEAHFRPKASAQNAKLHFDRRNSVGMDPEANSLHSSNNPPHYLTTSKQPQEGSLNTQALSKALQYAYENDLTSDYLLTSFSLSHLFNPLIQSTIPRINDDGFTGHSHLAHAQIPSPVVLDKSKPLTMTREALRLIDEARPIQSDEVIQALTEEVSNTGRLTHMKLELPLLRTDNMRDMTGFRKRYLNNTGAILRSIKEHNLPLHPQNSADGEGMELSSKARAECEMMQKKSEEEKVGVTKESFTYLFSLLKDEYTREDRMVHIIDEIQYRKTAGTEKFTPPVSPKLVPKQAAPIFDPQHLPIHSKDSSSLLSDNFHAIEDIMLGDHLDVWSASTSPIREFLGDLSSIAEPNFLEASGRVFEDLRVEVPLMRHAKPQQLEPAGPDAFGAFVESQMDLDPEFERAVLHDIPDDDLEESLQGQLEEAAQNSLRCIEQEQLQVIDAVARVPVPMMDFLIAEPSWQHLCGKDHSSNRLLKWMQAGKEELFKNPPVWPVDKISESKMVWSPLAPEAGNVPEKEDMQEGEPLLTSYLSLPPSGDVHQSQDCIHGREIVVIFANDDPDEEIEPQIRTKRPVVDLTNPVKKRSMEANAEGSAKKSRRCTIDQTSLDQPIVWAGPSLLPDDSSSASGNLLANFMEVYAPKKKVSEHSKYFTSAQSEPTAQRPPVSKQVAVQELEKTKAASKAPYPVLDPPSTALSVFIDIKIPRRMIRTLEGLLPDLTLLERDYDSHNIFVWEQSSVRRTEVKPPLADDADITVSPSTGIILTSMIRIRQRPRAGTNKGVIQIRVEKASLRYERLIVLVGGDGDKDEVVELTSSSDTTALLELSGFASGLESNVQVHYVGGGNKTLTHWVATFICRYGLNDQQVLSGLLESETLWEVFLRRAGLNVFAAQAVASQFKPPSDATDTMASASYGLGAFMTMTRDERVRRFGHLVGVRTLDRVSRNMDQSWNRG